MKLGPVTRTLLGGLGILATVTVAPPARGAEEDLADPTRKPGGINPADIDSRCSIMAGREDRAYLNCSGFVSETPSPGVEFILKNPPPPVVRYEEYENGRGATGPSHPRRR